MIYRKTDIQPYGLVLPLILDEKGAKYGKSHGKPVWLNRRKLSYFDFYQFFYRTTDADVERFLKMFTFLSDVEICRAMEQHLADKRANHAQQVLAEQVTLLVHGAEGLRVAKLATEIFYRKDIKAIESLEQDYMDDLFLPEQIVTMFIEPTETTLLDVAMKCRIFERELDCVKLIASGGLYANDVKCTDANERILDNRGKFILKN